MINDKLPMFPRQEEKRVTEARQNDNVAKTKIKKYADKKTKRSDVATGDQVLLKQRKVNKLVPVSARQSMR